MNAPPTPRRPNLRGAPFEEVVERLRAHGLREGAAMLPAALYRGVFVDRVARIADTAGVSPRKLAAAAEVFDDASLELVETAPSWDRSARYVFRCPDGALVESVRIHHHGRWTVCVSSQAGCALACRFCATGKLGVKRNLEAWEIVDQVLQVGRLSDVRISDIVFMGMGEPLMNEAEVYRAAEVMTEARGLQISARRIVISTAGVIPAIRRFVDDARPYRLVFSLGCAVPAKRLELMPVQAKWGFDELLDAIRRYEAYRGGKHVTLEYVAIRNRTMGDDDVEALRRLAETGLRFILNVIPLNPVDDADGLVAPTMEETRAWTGSLRGLGFPIKVRYSGGKDQLSGCGQLGRALLERGVL
ncbi:MAG TPA: radical SAM protein, partial [Planctomycetota bacterium]|nr:radical SAM protein [Planctomycetota bacterium]